MSEQPWDGFPEKYVPSETTRFRITYAWGVHEDFDDIAPALRAALAYHEQPTHDPALTRVSVFSCTLEHGVGTDVPDGFHFDMERELVK